MFEKLYEILDRAENLNDNDAWFFSVDSGVKSKVLQLNVIDQLYNRGVDALNESLGEYAPYTVEQKKDKGHRYANITLKDSGDFYRSFDIEVTKTEIRITADTIKEDGTDLAREFGEHIIGLTNENTLQVAELILENIMYYVKQELGLAA